MIHHKITFRVYYEDTDAAGIVYHSNYLKFAERARTEFLRESGFDQSKLMVKEEVIFPVFHIDIKFLSPAKLDDLLTIETRLLELKNVSMRMEQIIHIDQKMIAKLEVDIACVNLEIKPVKIPPQIKEALSKLI